MMSNCKTKHPCATLTPRRAAKRVILAGRFRAAGRVAEQLRKHGWEVLAAGDRDLHTATAETDPHAVLVSEDAGHESGYLATAKLLLARPDLKVAVVGTERTPERERFADFVGATFLTESAAAGEFADALE